MLKQQFSFLEDLGFRKEPAGSDNITLYSSQDLHLAFIDANDQVSVEVMPIVESHLGEWRDFSEVIGRTVNGEDLPDAIRHFVEMDDRPVLEGQEFIPLLFFTQAEVIFSFLVDDCGLTYDNPRYGFNHRNGHSLHYSDGDTRHVSIVFAAGRVAIQIKWKGADYNIERDIGYDDAFLESLASEIESLVLKAG